MIPDLTRRIEQEVVNVDWSSTVVEDQSNFKKLMIYVYIIYVYDKLLFSG